ncbi:ribosomal-protein-alanine acetyltransferase [Thermaerobacter marianensis DSM 12885]|uniref:Ribosomal-protein-alanine acetyltransferase n=1 Tax=Thermaerobacter marianensis (strain ATCC 700841 / DSM 12885 / JCM 10246 / 7p75a) TaxID=644966 RepID=E6SM63_THEM7|nr:ribosomal-protein-alanine acetyltransferase [Thermaerobacter marianensis DSM 12885]
MALSHDVQSQPGEIRIEPMTPGDLPLVLAIERRSFPTPWSERAFVGELRDNLYADYIVARHDGRVVGYAGMWCILDEAHVTTIAVDPDFRGRGVGDRLLTALEERALRYGCRRMTLEVRVSNHVAQRLYRRHGFRPCGIRRGYYVDNGEDAIIMWRDRLDPPGPVATEEPGPDGTAAPPAGAGASGGTAGAGALSSAAPAAPAAGGSAPAAGSAAGSSAGAGSGTGTAGAGGPAGPAGTETGGVPAGSEAP